MDFVRVTAILNKRKWFIVLSVIVGITLTWAATRLIGSKWTATVQFVSPQSSGLVNGEDIGTNGSIEAARSQAIMYATIVRSGEVLKPSLSQFDQSQISSDLVRNIEFTAVAPRLFQLQVTDNSMERSARLANALADNFLKAYHKVRTKQARKTVELLEEQIRDAKAKLKTARDSYDSYRDNHHILGSLGATYDAILSRMRDARQRRDDVDQKMADANARLRRAQAELRSLPATVSLQIQTEASPAAQRLQDQLGEAENQVAEVRARYNDSAPVVAQAVAARDVLAAKLKAEEQKRTVAALNQPNPARAPIEHEVRTLSEEIAGFQGLIATLNADISRSQNELGQYKGIDGPLGVLATEVASLTDAHGNLSARLRYARSLADMTETQDPLTVMDPAGEYNPPVNIAQGKSVKMVLVGALCSLIGMCGLVIGMDSLDRRVRSVKEAEIALPAAIITAIPQPIGAVTYSSLARATELHPQSIHSEAYRFLGLHLLAPKLSHIRSLMMLSAKAEQGSTTTLTNLGITLAQTGKRVVIVDANIRTAELHQVFGVPNGYGYTDLLGDPSAASVNKALQDTSVPNLQIITSGDQPANPWGLFRSPAVKEVAERLEGLADYVLYDTPSSVIFTDALNLAPVVDAAFLCVRALEPVTGAEARLVKQLEEAQVPVLGCVLTDVPAGVVEGYHNYQHYYGPAANAAALTAGPEPALALGGFGPAPLANGMEAGNAGAGEHDGTVI